MNERKTIKPVLLYFLIFFISFSFLNGEKSDETTDELKLDRKTFEKLPKGRDFTSIATLAPGVNRQSTAGTISIQGASTAENRFYIDGVETTMLYNGNRGMGIHYDFIEEIQVQTVESAGLSAEYSGSTGGVLNVITRSGGNEFHGAIIAYLEGSALDGKPRPYLKYSWFYDIASYITDPEDNRWGIEPGLYLGGPIIKNKLWFFAGFMPRFVTSKRDVEFQWDPKYNGEFTRKDTIYTGTLKITGQPFPNLRVSIHGTLDHSKWKGELPPHDAQVYWPNDWEANGFQYPRLSLGCSIDYTVGNHLNFLLKAGYYRSNGKDINRPEGPTLWPVPYFPTDDPDVYVHTDYGYYPEPRLIRDIQDRLMVSFDVAFHLNLMGKHALKTGVQMERFGVDKYIGYDQGLYFFHCLFDYYDYFNSPIYGLVPTTLGLVEIRDPYGYVSNLHSHRVGIYLQDSWSISRRFTLNLGIRMEKEDIPSFHQEYDSPIRFDFADKTAPRIGFTYDVLGDSTLKIYGGFGVYYDTMKLSAAELYLGGYKRVSHFYDLVNPDWVELVSYDRWKEVFYEPNRPRTDDVAGGTYFGTIDWTAIGIDYIQPDMKPFRKDEFTFGIRKTIGENWVLRGSFLHNYIKNAVDDVGIRFPDRYVYYFLGNPGSDWIQQKFNENLVPNRAPMEGVRLPKAVRRYTAVTFSLERKLKDNWLVGMYYTWSRLYGNYSGLMDAKEENWRNYRDSYYGRDPNLTRQFDVWFLFYNQFGEEELGLLGNDRTHQLKFYGAYVFDFGLTLGVHAYAVSGTPLQTESILNGYPGFYPLGRASDGRTPFLWQIDFYAEFNLKLSKRFTLQFNLDITNISNNDMARGKSLRYNWGTIILQGDEIINGFDYAAVVEQQGRGLSSIYNKEFSYLDSIAARLGVKLMF